MAILRTSNFQTAQYLFVNKKSQGLAAVFLFVHSLLFLSCKKLNEATELGGDLIPAVDNVNTFELSLETETDNILFLNDTTELLFQDQTAIGALNDPEFGKTQASSYFNISSSIYSKYPFINKTGTVEIDSVVLSLGYKGVYGDSTSMQTLRVFEVNPSSTLYDTAFYKYAGTDFTTTGAELGFKTFAITSLNDTIPVIRKDTQKVANVVRIRLNNSLGSRFASYDTTNTANGGFYNDSLFQILFKGLAIKADVTGNALTYFDIFDTEKSRLIVYFRSTKDSKTDTASAIFYHLPLPSSGGNLPGGIANIIKRTPGGNWSTYLSNGNSKDDKLFIQSSPGSYGGIKIPALNTLANKTVHLAELIAYRLPSAQDNIFTVPPRLYLDKFSIAPDTAFLFENDQPVGSSGQPSYNGGILRTDNAYRFNITRHVQGILTRKEPNLLLRLYAPFRTEPHVKNVKDPVFIPVADRIADGRVVLAGGNYTDPNLRLRLRLVYSNL
jgi:hypothetical protein